jgi:uracil-DNA glycosylase
MSPKLFINALKALNFNHAFNPYLDRCAVHDLIDAPKQREKLLLEILGKATSVKIDAIWIGRDLGYRGGRRTGLALTDDINFESHLARWEIIANRPTKGIALPERTADSIWGILNKIAAPIFLWNVFPLHPYEPGNPFSNRQHNAKERRAGVELLEQLLILLKPERIIAIGNDAAKVVSQMQTESPIKVRHPSYGGQAQFLAQMRALYSLEMTQQATLFDTTLETRFL